MAQTNDLTAEFRISGMLFRTHSKNEKTVPDGFNLIEFVDEINKLFNEFHDISFVNVNEPLFTVCLQTNLNF